MPGKRSLEDIDRFAYTSKLQEYRDEGGDLIWGMKDGTDIMIKDMTDSHVKNTINMLKRKPYHGRREAWIKILESEQLNRRFKKIDKITKNINLDDDVLRDEE